MVMEREEALKFFQAFSDETVKLMVMKEVPLFEIAQLFSSVAGMILQGLPISHRATMIAICMEQVGTGATVKMSKKVPIDIVEEVPPRRRKQGQPIN